MKIDTGYGGSVGQLLNIVLVTLRRGGYRVAPRAYSGKAGSWGKSIKTYTD